MLCLGLGLEWLVRGGGAEHHNTIGTRRKKKKDKGKDANKTKNKDKGNGKDNGKDTDKTK